MTFIHTVLACIITTLMITNLCIADTTDIKKEIQNTDLDPIAVTIMGDPGNRIGNPVYFGVRIKNVTSQDLTVENVTIKIDGAAADRLVAKKDCPLQLQGEPHLQKGQSFEQTCRFEMKPLDKWWTLKYWQDTLLITNVIIAVTVDIRDIGELYYYPSVPVQPSEMSVFIGGVFGALLLSIFVWINSILKIKKTREAWFKSFLFTLLMGIRGGIMAIIALLLGKTTQGAGAPISLTVADFTGGIMIGLFSYPLASWISSALKLDDRIASRNNSPDKLQ